MTARQSHCRAAGVFAGVLFLPAARAQPLGGSGPVPGWLWAALGMLVVLCALAALLVLRQRALLRELRLQDAALQESQGVLQDANSRLQHELAELRAAEATNSEALAQARRLDRQHSAFLAQMNHEVRAPLNGILYFANVLQRDPLTERQQRGLRTIEESGQQLLALVTDIVDLARIDSGKVELAPSDVALTAFLLRVSDTARAQADARGLLFSMRAAQELPAAVRVHEGRLRQVLLSLLSNAVKLTERGQVSLDVKPLAPAQPSVEGEPSVRLRFEVRDSGPAMSEAQLARFFEPFGQLDEVTDRSTGAGLALAISRRLVRLMGSDIQAIGRRGEGNVFCFELDVPVLAVGAAASVVSQGPRRLLDDGQPSPGDRVDGERMQHVAPPSEELTVLRELARVGNMRTIRERAEYLKGLDPRYGPFADKLAKLAEQFQSKAILNLVESTLVEKGFGPLP